jgi:mRNA-degrading endonuclease YafQ of YafQ-DinJ toxin-antitoxin module
MNIVLHRRFTKMAAKLTPRTKQKMVERMALFAQDPTNSQLRSHSLNTPYRGSYSIDITGDVRAIYELVDDETALFSHIGTHSQLYR